MSLLQDINPLEPLLWVNDEPLLTLTYLWHFSTENLKEEQRVDLLWQLTRQLILAVAHKEEYTIPSKDLEIMIEELEKDPAIKALLESKVITKETLSQIITNQEIDFHYQEHLLSSIINDLTENDEEIHNYYDEKDNFAQNDVYEVYEYFGKKDLNNLSTTELESLVNDQEFIFFAGLPVNELQALDPKIETELSLPKVLKHPQYEGGFLYIKAFHEHYKPSYELVKKQILDLFAQSLKDQKLEEEAQSYLDNHTIRYNEKALEKVLKLENL